MHQLFRKLKLKPHTRAAILYAPEGFPRGEGDLPEGVRLVDEGGLSQEPQGAFDFVHLFVRSVAELEERAPMALGAVKYDGLLWISYPKKSGPIKTDITRDVGWDVVREAGLRPVAQISVDETWSALRFRPAERVG